MQNIENIIKSRIENNKANSFVVIVPNEAARLIRQRKLVSYHGNNSVANLKIYDIETFIQRLFANVFPPRQTISMGLQHLWLHEIVNPDHNPLTPSEFSSFRPVDDNDIPDSTLNLIANSINQLKDRGESVDTVISNQHIDADLIRIYQEYEEKLHLTWIDDRGKHLYLADNFEKGYFKRAFPTTDLLAIEGFSILSKSDIEIFKQIAGISDLEVWFRTDCFEDNTNLYTNIANLVANFRDENVHIDSDFDRYTDDHQYLAENLFQTNSPLENRRDLTKKINVLSPSDRSEEVEQIAFLIRKHIDEDKYKLSDICVTYYNINQYKHRIAETFDAFGIPYSLSENIPLNKSSIIKEILSRLTPHQKSSTSIYFDDSDDTTFPQILNPDEFSEYIDNFLNTGDVLNKIINPMLSEKREIVEAEINALQNFKRIVNELCDFYKTDEEKSYPYIEYLTKLQHLAKHTYFQNRSLKNRESVNILPVSELRSLEYKIVILGGFVDGGFPQYYNPDPLLPETPYHTREEQLYDNRFLFYRLLKSFSEYLYMLVPQHEQETELIPSLFLSQLKAIADIGELKIENPGERSIYGFLSSYGKFMYNPDSTDNVDFPTKLTELRPLIDHVAEVEKSREKTNQYPTYEGNLIERDNLGNLTISQASKERLQQFREKTYSITDLETYANCPYQFFISKVLKYIIKVEEEEEELTALEKGSLIHNVVAAFYTNRRDNRDPLISQCSDEDFSDAIKQINEIVDNLQSVYRNDENYAVPERNLYWTIDIDKTKVALHKWLAAERDYDIPLLPSYFEVGIGRAPGRKDQTLYQQEPILIGNVKMEGKIDRIDIGSDNFNIIDYKTGGTTPSIHNIQEGRALQVPIYLQLVKKILENKEDREFFPSAGLYHKIRLDECKVELGVGKTSKNGETYQVYANNRWYSSGKSSGQLLEDNVFESTLDRVTGYIQQYVEDISEGIFPIITRVNSYVNSVDEGERPIRPKVPTAPCSYCNYLRICRVGAFTEKSDDES